MDLEGSAIVQRESWLAYQWLLDQMQTHGEGVLKDYFLPAHTLFIKAESPEEAVRLAFRNHLRKSAD